MSSCEAANYIIDEMVKPLQETEMKNRAREMCSQSCLPIISNGKVYFLRFHKHEPKSSNDNPN